MLAAIACRKYKEDSFISLRTPYQRITGDWSLEYIGVDNVDVTSTFIPKCNGANFYNDGAEHFYNSCCSGGGYRISKNSICFKECFFFNRAMSCFTILKLYSKDLWLQTDYNNSTYLLKFKKQ
jgi:hypothetical protein